jgi:phosphoenolpyruvate phosphomutase
MIALGSKNETTTDARRATLRQLLGTKRCLRFIEAHSPLSALLAQSLATRDERTDESVEYDGFWSSSLTDATERGKPDIEVLDIPSRLLNISDIFEVTTKPLIIDGDTGGKPEHFIFHVRSMERIGISAVVIEDKTGLKRNSLLGNDVEQVQEGIGSFSQKIATGKAARTTKDFMIIARIESLILEKGMDDALERSFAYVAAGADGIMIHSRRKECDEVVEFAKHFRHRHPDVPLVGVPTSYCDTYWYDMERAGFNIVIYANHMLRSSYLAMRSVALDILKHGRSLEVEERCLSINEVLALIPGTR